MFFIFSYLNGISQNIDVKSKFEKIKILDDHSFVNEITIIFKKSEVSRLYPIFYDTKLEYIANIKLFEKRRKKFKEIPLKKIYENDVELDYISSKKIKSIQIPPNKDIKLTYSITCSELMYFSSLQFFSYYAVDSLKYQIKVPKKFAFAHNIVNKDSLPNFYFDSIKNINETVWKINLIPKKIEPDPLSFFRIYKNIKAPLMRTLVTPIAYKDNPTKYMNDWYTKSLISKKGLNDIVKKKIDELTFNINDQNKILNIIYNYVKKNFKYVAIEVGMGAFIPTPANEVFLNKQGDCKDLSNFLSEALNYKGIKSNVALAATFNHISNCDFPSLSSANHVICIAYLKDKKILLDPTDPIHIEQQPVQSLQDRTIFIINSEGGTFYNVDKFTPKQNEISYNVNLNLNSEKSLIKGNFNINYKGISGNFLKRFKKSESEKNFNNFQKNLYEEIFGNQSVTDISTIKSDETLNLKGKISISGKTFNDGQNKYLFIDFLPRIIETENRETLIEGTYLNNPFYKKVKVKIKLDQPIERFKTKEHSFKGKNISLNLKIKFISNIEIECSYNFIFNHLFINKENIEKINKILKSFKKITNEPIVLQKQKK